MHISTYIGRRIEMRLGERGKARPLSNLCPKSCLLVLSEGSFKSRPGITAMSHHARLKGVCTLHSTSASQNPQDGGLQISGPSLGPSYPLVDSKSLIISSWCLGCLLHPSVFVKVLAHRLHPWRILNTQWFPEEVSCSCSHPLQPFLPSRWWSLSFSLCKCPQKSLPQTFLALI